MNFNTDSITREQIREARNYLRDHGVIEPDVGIILGSGLNGYADRIENAIKIDYEDIPNFSTGKASGHRGELVFGEVFGKKVAVLAGRFHYYEGRSMDRTTLSTKVLLASKIKRLIVTNAAGCINENWRPGELMLLSDHINLCGDNPLIGDNLEEFGPRFPDMTDTYNKVLRDKLKKACADEDILLREGVYAMMSGPSFETPAEIKFLKIIGADAVGMSTVPEAIVANQAGKEIIGISMLGNMAAGILDQPLCGAEVDETGAMVKDTFAKVVDLAIQI